jgi:putative addiction module component (TIGR02574 family)
MAMSPTERIELIGALCDSLEADDLPVSDAWKAELDRRNATFAQDRKQASPWHEVRARLRSRQV